MMGPKEKRERALGVHLELKADRCSGPKCAMVRKPYKPGAHGQARGGRGGRRSGSEMGVQLKEKQKFKLIYGFDERGLSRIWGEAQRAKGSSTDQLLTLAESRLDSVLYRAGLCRSRIMARQAALHGHIAVNGVRVRSPSYHIKKGDTIALYAGSRGKTMFGGLGEYLKKYESPAWIQLDKEKFEAKVIGEPAFDQPPFEINLIVESLSK